LYDGGTGYDGGCCRDDDGVDAGAARGFQV
jgi:hypothetical protein